MRLKAGNRVLVTTRSGRAVYLVYQPPDFDTPAAVGVWFDAQRDDGVILLAPEDISAVEA